MVDNSALIADAVANTLSPIASQRRTAEEFLSQSAANTLDFPVILLQLIASNSAPPHIRQATAVFLKNTTAKVYAAEDDPSPLLPSYDRVKTAIVDTMLAAPTPIRRQLGEVLATIAEHDYPIRWPQLVSSLSDKLTAILREASTVQQPESLISVVDWSMLSAILETLHAIFDRYPERMRSDKLYSEINHSLKHSQEHVLALFQLVVKVLDHNLPPQDPDRVKAYFSAADVLIRVFYCLSWQDLPEFFEDHIQEYMTQLRRLLVFSSDFVDALSDDEKGPLDDVHAASLEVANIYATKYDEEFRPFVQQFVSDAWSLLMRRGNAPRFDIVVTTGIKFLSTVARSPDYHLFKDPSALSGVCNRIVIPNIEIRDEDVEMFEDDPYEYVRHDLEGSDTGTRRRGAVELVKGLCVHFEKEVTEVFASYVQSIFSPETDWRKRDTAIYLVIALGWKSGTLMRGVTETSSLINIPHFFTSFVLPQLTASSKNAAQLDSPIFIADLLKFVIAFRHQISVDGCAEALTVCAELLAARETVVRTYCAACIERLLTMREDGGANKSNGNVRRAAYRINKDRVQPLLPSILSKVVTALKGSARPDEYMMRLVLRLCAVCRDGMGPHVQVVLPVLVELFVAAAANPANPMFNHYLFETFAALIRFNATPTTVGAFEQTLMSPLCDVLINDVTEFGPYVFQVLSQLMSVRTGNLPDRYASLMGPILNPAMWGRRAYVAGMVLYIETYLQRGKDKLLAEGQMEPTLGVFQKLIASKATDHYGLHLLSTIFETFDAAALSRYQAPIFNALLVRLSQAKTPKYVTHLLRCLSTFVLRFGAVAIKTALDAVQPQVFAMLLKQVWVPDVAKARHPNLRRLCAVALTELACGSELCLVEPYTGMWPDMIEANVALVEGMVLELNDDEAEQAVEEEEEDVAVLLGAAETYSATVSQLKWGINLMGRPSALVAEKDPKLLLFSKVSDFVEKHKAQFHPLFEQKVNAQARQMIASYGNVQQNSAS